MIGDAGEDVSEPGAGIDVVEPARLDKREHGGGAVAAAVTATEGPVLSSDGDAAHGPLGGIIAHAEPAVVEEAREGAPSLQRIVDRLGGIVFRREFLALLAQPGFECFDQRLRSRLSYRAPLVGWLAVDLAFDGEQRIDPLHGFNGDRCFLQFGEIKELAAASMRSIAAR
jgi:hypothetical protein